jgi:hypothetical protein
MRRLTRQAVEVIPAFTRTVETPLGGYFDTLAFYLAWLIAFGFFFKTYRENNGFEWEDLLWYWARVAVCLGLLSYCGDVNGDGLRGDLYNKLGHMGNSLAYGTPERDFEDSYIGGQVAGAKDVFAGNYRDFVHNKFMYKVNNEDCLVRYPGDTQGFQWFVARYSGNDALANVTQDFQPNGWNMANLFTLLNVGRSIIEFGDLWLLFLQGLLAATLRMAAPFMVAVAVDREYAKRISINFVWGCVVATIVMPVVAQALRWFAYSASNLAMDAGSSRPYYTYDPTTAKVIAQGNPEYIIIICAFTMIFFGLLMALGTPWLSYQLAMGRVFESVSGSLTNFAGSLSSAAVSAYSVAASAAFTKQAEEKAAFGQAQAEAVTARAARKAADIGTAATLASTLGLSRAEANSQVGNLQATNWGQNEKARAAQARTESEQEANVAATDVEQDARLINAGVNAQRDLDDATMNNLGPAGPLYGIVDNVDRAAGNGGIRGQAMPERNGNGQPAGWEGATARPFVPMTPPGRTSHLNGLGYRPMDRSSGNRQYDALIDSNARRLGIDPNFSIEVFRKETGGFQSSIITGRQQSPMGASGFGQMMPETARQYGLKVGNGVDERNDPNKAIPAAMRMHRDLLKANGGNPILSAAAYNAGQGAVNAHLPNNSANSYVGGSGKRWTVSEATAQKAQGIPQNAETRDYVATIGSRLGIGNYRAYQTPAGVREIMAMTGNSRSETRARRDAFIGVENAEREAIANTTGARIRAAGVVNAGEVYTAREIGINNTTTQWQIGIARQAQVARDQTARELAQQQHRANAVTAQGQLGDPNANQGSAERMGAIEIRHQAQRESARLRASAALTSGLGSILSSQINNQAGAFSRF